MCAAGWSRAVAHALTSGGVGEEAGWRAVCEQVVAASGRADSCGQLERMLWLRWASWSESGLLLPHTPDELPALRLTPLDGGGVLSSVASEVVDHVLDAYLPSK